MRMCLRPHSLVCLVLVVTCWLVLPANQRLSADQPDKTNKLQAGQSDEDAEYLELLRLLADVIDEVDRNYVKEVDRRALVESAVRGIVRELDPYSDYISPRQLERFRRGVEAEFGGIGIQVSTGEDEFLQVISPMYGTPAYRAGLKAGDRITEIEGHSTKGITLDKAVKLMKGKVGSKVHFKVLHPDKDSTLR